MASNLRKYDHHKLTITTDASGAGADSFPNVNGVINSIRYEPVSGSEYSDGATFIVTDSDGFTLFTGTITAGATAQSWFPSPQTHDPADGTANVDGLGVLVIVDTPLTITVASGGNTKSGVFHVDMR